jgi:LPXTG-motif cell wall-anchored protein
MNDITTSPTRRIARFAALWTGSSLLFLAGAAPALADPPGNNGTVKVDGVDFDSHPDNEPHVGCTFQVDFYGFDESVDYFADVTFEAQAPTGSGVLLTDSVFIGEDDNSGAATPEGLDAAVEYDLTDALAEIAPHPEQGHHVKLTIEADGSQGSETKHKVFWVEGCTPEEPPSDEPPIDEPPAEEPPAEEPPSVLSSPPVTRPAPQVLGTTVTPAASAAALPRTGSSTTVLAAAGLALIALGTTSRRLGVRLGGR